MGTKVLLFDPICKQKVATTIISGLSGNKLSRKDILVEYVVVKVQEVFMIDVVIPYVDMIGDTQLSKMKDYLGAVIIWSSKFLRIATCEAQENQPFS
jgi:hypothetical protein